MLARRQRPDLLAARRELAYGPGLARRSAGVHDGAQWLVSVDMNPASNPDAARARELLEKSRLRNESDQMLRAAQVHATLAVEQAVRDLIDKLEPR